MFSIHNSFGIEQENNEPYIQDFKKTVIHENSEIILNSGWEFYWNELLYPKEFNTKNSFQLVSLNNWTNFNVSKNKKLPSFGYATYRLRISIPKKRPSLSLYIPKIFSASKTWVNGKLVSEIGQVSTNKEATIHKRFSQIIPIDSHQTDFEIIIQVSNFYHSKGGITEPVILSSTQHLHTIKAKRIIADMFFIGCVGFMGVFFLFFYMLYWNKDKAVVYFAIFCVSLSYMALSDRYAPLAKIFENVNWILLTKVEYLSLYLAGISSSLFFNDIFYDFTHKRYSKTIIYILSSLSILVICLPAPYFTKLLLPFLLLMMLNLLYIFFVILKSLINKRLESILLLISMLLGSFTFFVHIYFFIGENEAALIYVNFGYIFVFLLLSMLLMTRFSNAFKELEISKEIALKQKQEISIKSNELSNANLKLEENLKLLKNYNTELDDFNHIVSHDLKSPLISIFSLASFIEEDLKTTLNEGTKYHLKLLKGVVSKMDALINGLLEYSKVAKGNKPKELFKLNDLLNKVIDLIDNQKQSTIHLPDNNLQVYANKIELEHVFQNLISNAIKHNDKDKTIITISVIQQTNQYLFSVSDNGPGIEPEYHAKIFKIFSQLKINDDVESTGIGLAIVKKIISQNLGEISINSKKGKGITITFSWKILNN